MACVRACTVDSLGLGCYECVVVLDEWGSSRQHCSCCVGVLCLGAHFVIRNLIQRFIVVVSFALQSVVWWSSSFTASWVMCSQLHPNGLCCRSKGEMPCCNLLLLWAPPERLLRCVSCGIICYANIHEHGWMMAAAAECMCHQCLQAAFST
jgi:hypothetical protein